MKTVGECGVQCGGPRAAGVVLAVVLALLGTACSASHPGAAKPVVTSSTTVAPHVGCDAVGARMVRHLASRTGSVWTWIESAASSHDRVGALIKVVWRITGTGTPRVGLSDPGGRAVPLAFGPELHGRSTFHHPGDEYGTGFTPTGPGCWRMTMTRGAVSGSLSFLVTRATAD